MWFVKNENVPQLIELGCGGCSTVGKEEEKTPSTTYCNNFPFVLPATCNLQPTTHYTPNEHKLSSKRGYNRKWFTGIPINNMPPRSAEEKARRKKLHQERLEARKLKKQQEEKARQELSKTKEEEISSSSLASDNANTKTESECLLFIIPDDAFHNILNFLPARDLGSFSMTCRHINLGLNDGCVHHLFSRLCTTKDINKSSDEAEAGKLRVPIKICESENQVKELLAQALEGCGNTGRVITKKSKKGHGSDEYICFARFIEEAVLGRSVQVSR